MGGMIACKLAAAAPSRVRSLTLIGATGGGIEVSSSCSQLPPSSPSHPVDPSSSIPTLLSSPGHAQCVPPLSSLGVALRFLRADSAPKRAAVDLECHFTDGWLAVSLRPSFFSPSPSWSLFKNHAAHANVLF